MRKNNFQLHVHGKGDYLEFEQAQYVMGVVENKPAGTLVGSTRLANLLFVSLVFSASYFHMTRLFA